MSGEIFVKAGDYFAQGGWIMFPIAALSLVMWALIVDRYRWLGSMATRDIPIGEAIARVRTAESRPCEAGGIRACLVSHFNEERSGDPCLDREILRQCSMQIKRGLDRNLLVIAVLASIAPLLGLLGTVLGMIETFDVISLFGTGNAKAMAGGISVALITTQTGLLVAIPGLFLSGVLNRRARHLGVRLDEITMILGRVVLNDPTGEDEGDFEKARAGELQTA